MNSRWLAKELARGQHGLVGFWPLTNDFKDHSGRGSHAGVIGPGTTGYSGRSQMGGRQCFRGSTYNLSGSGSGYTDTTALGRCLNVPYNKAWDFEYNQPFTISAWYYSDISADNAAFFSHVDPSTGAGYTFGTDGEWYATCFYTTAGDHYNVVANAPPINYRNLPPGWHHAVVVYDGSLNRGGIAPTARAFRFFVDGVPLSPEDNIVSSTWGTSAASMKTSASALIGGDRFISSGQTYYERFSSAYNLVRVYNHAIRSQAIADLYRREKAAFTHPYMHADYPYSSQLGITLFLTGFDEQTSNTTLFIYGIADGVRPFNLFLDGSGTIADNEITLTVFGTTNTGFTGNVDLIVYADNTSDHQTRSMPLFLDGPSQGETVRYLNLFVSGEHYSCVGSVPLLLNNTGVNNSTTLFIQGEGETPGAIPYAKGLNLFLQRSVGTTMPMFLMGPATDANFSTTLYVYGETEANASITMVVPQVIGDEQGSTTMYTSGF